MTTGREPAEGTEDRVPLPVHGLRSALRRRPAARAALVVVLVAALAAAGLYLYLHLAGRESTDDAQLEGNIAPVAARVGGVVVAVRVADNQQVEVGTTLVELDPADYKVAVARAEAELADAEAAARAAAQNVPVVSGSTEGDAAAARALALGARQDADAQSARQREAEATLTRAAADLERARRLVQKDEISRQQYDAAVAAEAAARAAVEGARSAVAAADERIRRAEAQVRAADASRGQVGVVGARAAAAQALVGQKRAALEQAKLNLSYTTIKAAVGGVVSKKSVQPGQVVAPGQPLLALVPLDDVWVVANFKENQLRRMRSGQRASVHVDAYGRDYEGRVESVGGATAAKFSLLPPENATGNFVKVVQRVPVKIVLDPGQDAERRLRPGLSVVPTVFTDGGGGR
ncbi:MAG: HlyD family secretion protein [Candidatus Polarisedimenticolia bacterium]